MNDKVCERCAVALPAGRFYPGPAEPDGLSRRCIECCIASASTYGAAGTGTLRNSAEQRQGWKAKFDATNAAIRAENAAKPVTRADIGKALGSHMPRTSGRRGVGRSR